MYAKFDSLKTSFTMKLTIDKVVMGSCRLGMLREVGKQKTLTLETPLCILHTRAGSVANLSIDVLNYIPQLPSVALMPLNLLAEHHETLQEYKKGIAEFTSMKDFAVCCTMHDPATAVPSGYNDKATVALWTRGGKMKVDPELFCKVQEAFQPDWFLCLADADTPRDASKKRCKKSVDNTLNFLDYVLDRRKHSEVLQKMALFGSVTGGLSPFERERSAKETVSRNVDGFVLEGFQSDGEEFCQFENKEFVDVLQHTLRHLPADRPRMMCGVWRPDMVIRAMKAGIDIFDTSYTYTAAERNQALVFDFNYNKAAEEVGRQDVNGDEETKTQLSCGFTVDLSEKRFSEDLGPILNDCECYTCRTFSSAYLHHLINTTELQGGVLLMIHNLHHYLGFFRAVRQSLREDRFHELESLIAKQTTQSEGR